MMRKTLAVFLLLVALKGHYCIGGFSWQRLARRASVRAALASKMDPNFWPTRGRRSDFSTQPQNYEYRRQTTDEEGPFWANRGRSLTSFIKNSSLHEDYQKPEDLAKILELETFLKPGNHRFSARSDEGPFWANRGRSINQIDWIKQLLTSDKSVGRSVDPDQGPFWANRGRSVENKQRWASNQNRDVVRSDVDKETLFWANRGRSANKESDYLQEDMEETPFGVHRDQLFSKDADMHQRDVLYAEEPGWTLVTPRNDRRSALPSDVIDTFWSARGKKSQEDKGSK